MRATLNPFSHIQIVPKKSEVLPTDENEEPTFRKASFIKDAEADAGMTTRELLRAAKSPESLANNTQGATFAAKARAAELQAARTRNELKTQHLGSTVSRQAATHETMTFKSKSKGGKTWKRLNLSEIPGTSEDEDAESPINRQSSDTSLVTQGQPGVPNFDDFPATLDGPTKVAASHSLPSLQHPPGITQTRGHNHEMSNKKNDLSPDTLLVEKSLENYDTNQWDPDSVKYIEHPRNTRILNHPSPAELVLQPPRLDPIPVLPAFSPEGNKDADYLTRKQDAQILEVHRQLNNALGAAPLRLDSRGSRHELQHHARRSERFQPSTMSPEFVGQTGDIAQISPFDFAESLRHSYSQPSFVAPLKSKPPHHYPAVKGTMNNGFKFPPSGLSKFPPPGLPPPQPPVLHNGNPVSNDGSPHRLQNQPHRGSLAARAESRRTSTAEKHNMLLKHLDSVAENALGRQTPRTVLHDPFGSEDTISPVKPLLASEALPWKTRPVEVIQPPYQHVEEDFAIVLGFKMTPHGVFGSLGEPVTCPATLSNSNTAQNASSASTGAWWTRDSRFTYDTRSGSSTVQRVYEWAERNTTDEGCRFRFQQATERAALRNANFSDDKPLAPGAPEHTARNDALDLMLPVIANLKEYSINTDHFNRLGDVPEWCIDHGATVSSSLFGEDWGAPPARVGRDPRYKPMQYDNRGAINESPSPRWSKEGYGGRGRQFQR